MSFAQLKQGRLARQVVSFSSSVKKETRSLPIDLSLREAVLEVSGSEAENAVDLANIPAPEDPEIVREEQAHTIAIKDGSCSVLDSVSSIESFAEGLDERNGLHAVIPSTLFVKQTGYAGRGVFSSQHIKSGSTVFDTPLHASVLSTPHLPAFCSLCYAPATSDKVLKRCARCQVSHYCSSKCSEADWRSHKPECAALRRWAAAAPNQDVSVPSEAIRCIARMLWAKQRQGMESIFAQELDSMQSNRASLADSLVDAHMHLAHALVRYLGLSSPAELAPFGIGSAGTLVDLLSRFSTNALTLSEPALAPIGVYASPAVALLNHSCQPNAAAVFPELGTASGEVRVRVVAMRDIRPGDEITTSYIDTTLPAVLRQTTLKETYRFDCSCSLCALKTYVDPCETLWCPRACGGTCPFPREESSPPACARCNAVVPIVAPILDAIRLATEGLAKAQSIQGKDPAHTLRLAENFVPLLRSAGLTPSSHPLLALVRLRQPFLIDGLASDYPEPADAQKSLDDAVRGAAAVVTGLDMVLQEGHPVRAIARAELGKLLASDEPAPSNVPSNRDSFPPSGARRLMLAKEMLTQAHRELMIGFGRDGGGGMVGRQVRELIIRMDKEMEVLKLGVKNVRESG